MEYFLTLSRSVQYLDMATNCTSVVYLVADSLLTVLLSDLVTINLIKGLVYLLTFLFCLFILASNNPVVLVKSNLIKLCLSHPSVPAQSPGNERRET